MVNFLNHIKKGKTFLHNLCPIYKNVNRMLSKKVKKASKQACKGLKNKETKSETMVVNYIEIFLNKKEKKVPIWSRKI